MQRLRIIILSLSLGLAFGRLNSPPVEPPPPTMIVNHATHQCALLGEDECHTMLVPDGWEVLGPDNQVDCPAGYTMVDVNAEVYGYKTTFCCGYGMEGTGGDCEDVVVNYSTGQCAFVDDIHTCPNLPAGWEAYGDSCPYGPAGWPSSGDERNVACLTDQDAARERSDLAQKTVTYVLGAAAAGALLLLVILTRRSQRSRKA